MQRLHLGSVGQKETEGQFGSSDLRECRALLPEECLLLGLRLDCVLLLYGVLQGPRGH